MGVGISTRRSRSYRWVAFLAFALGINVLCAGSASATDVLSRVEKCSLKRFTRFDDDRRRDREREKYFDFLVDGTTTSPVVWNVTESLVLSFPAVLEKERKADYVEGPVDPGMAATILAEYGIDGGFTIVESEVSGRRRVGRSLRRARDRFKLTATVSFTDGVHQGRTLLFGLRAYCFGKVEDPIDPPPDDPIRVVLIGSSTAAGKNLDAPIHGGRVGGLVDRYSNLYQSFLNATWPGSVVDNLGRPGASTYEALPTNTATPIPGGLNPPNPAGNVTFALSLNPDAILINYPARREPTLADYVANHREVYDFAAASGVPVWVALPHPATTTGEIAEQSGMRDALVAEFGNSVLDFYSARLGPDNLVVPATQLLDGVHPNATGHALLFDVIVEKDLPTALGRTSP